MSKTIRELYKKKGLDITAGAPKGGKGIHTYKAHDMVSSMIADGMDREKAWRITMSKLGKKAVKKSHQRS